MRSAFLKVLSGVAWAHREFAGAQLGDRRLVARAAKIAQDFAAAPGTTIPRACKTWTNSKAAYRFFDHDNVTPSMLLAGHVQTTIERMRSVRVVLAVQDTTTLDYGGHFDTEGLGPINNQKTTNGMLLHGTIAFTPEKMPLGVLQARLWSRNRDSYGSNRKRNGKKLCEKESHRWLESFQATCEAASQLPQTQFVNLADREGDVYEVLAAALEPGAAAVLIRAQHNRGVVEGRAAQLREHMRAHDAAQITVDVPRHGKRPSRKAECEVRFGSVILRAPLLKEEEPALQGVWFIEVREISSAKEPILWRLLTTLPLTTLEQALEKVRWYTVRWQIEVFHRTLKTGCGVEKLQLESANKLRLAIAIKLVVAWRVMALIHCSRATPDRPAEDLLSAGEVIVLVAVSAKKLDARKLTLRQATHAIAALGGFLGRRSDGEPGALSLWYGLQQLSAMTQAAVALKNCG